MEVCALHKRVLNRELFDAVCYGHVGGYEVAMRMPTEVRRFWLQQVLEDRKARDGESEGILRGR